MPDTAASTAARVGTDGTAEQDINLSIAKRVQVLANFFGVPTAMTRPDENALDYNPSRTVRENKIADIKAREKLVNSIPSPVFLSIHLNKFSDAQYHGAPGVLLDRECAGQAAGRADTAVPD